MRLAVVDWVDSNMADAGDIIGVVNCTSLGFVVEDSPESIVLAGTFCEGEPGQFLRMLAIPRGAIVSVFYPQVPEA
jgi:hypothetical protein